MAKFVARKPEKEAISMRISTDLLQTLDEKAKEIDISRKELINQMIMFALENMEDSSVEKLTVLSYLNWTVFLLIICYVHGSRFEPSR